MSKKNLAVWMFAIVFSAIALLNGNLSFLPNQKVLLLVMNLLFVVAGFVV